MAVDIQSYLKKETDQNAQDKAEHLRELYRFIADRFVTDSPPYTLTSWLSNEMLYESNPKDYIIYPSICTEQQGCNLAFHPNSADTLLRFRKILRIEFVHCDGGNIRTKNHSVGELDGPHLRWRSPSHGELSEIMQGGNYCDLTDTA